jgi:hypothetical protein
MAAIDFPNSPTVGDLFTQGDITWEWTGTVWKGLGDSTFGPAGVAISTSEPESNEVLWLDTDEEPDVPVPAGGSAGQLLSKIDGTDYNTEWKTTDGVRVFTNSSTRTTAIPSPTRGATTYLNDIDSLQTHNGSAWVPAAGLNLITSQNFGSVNAVNFDGIYSSLYKNYQIIVSFSALVGTSVQIFCQHRQGGSTVDTNYRNQRLFNYDSIIVSDTQSYTGSAVPVISVVDSTNLGGAFAVIYVANPFLLRPTSLTLTSTSGFGPSTQLDQRTSSVQNQSISITGFRIQATGSNQMSGTIDVYGIK